MKPKQGYARPSLWFTLGPATLGVIDEAIESGVNGVRYTLSYATPDVHVERARTIAARAAMRGARIYAIADLPGEKFRLSSFSGEVLGVSAGDRVRLGLPGQEDPTAAVPILPVQTDGLFRSTGPGSHIIVGDGTVELVVEDAGAEFLLCQVVRGGAIENNRGLVLVEGAREPASLTPLDLDMLRAVAESGAFDAVAISFLSDPADIQVARKVVWDAGADLAIIAKIETRTGVDRIEEITATADVVMAARGDLAFAVGPPMLYAAVSRIASAAVSHGKPWILATQLMESLEYVGFATRAELTDVVGWLERGASGAMLSRETVFGKRPLESIRMLRSLLDVSRKWPSPERFTLG